MTRLGALLAALLLSSCISQEEPTKGGTAPPALRPDVSTAASVAVAADEARRIAYARDDPASLGPLYAPALLAGERSRLAVLASRGVSVDEEVTERRVVHVGGSINRPEVVLAVRGRLRRAAAGSAPRPWSAFARQTALDLVPAGDHWVVERTQDLAPAQWWRS